MTKYEIARKLGLQKKKRLRITKTHKMACKSLANANFFLGPFEDYGLFPAILEALEERGLAYYFQGKYLLTEKGKSFVTP